MFRLGIAQALAYRAELIIWMLTSTMPLIMLPLWHAVAEQAPIAGFSQSRFTAYFLAGFVIRQMVGNWASWTINSEVRTGALNRRLLRPIHPLIAYATESLSTIPVRSVVALPVGLLALAVTGADHLASAPLLVLMAPLSV
ncbi:MAG TPA: ABC transporter permease, partial [Polyangiaceae bacterium]|nr:ABC transporter permease [Polyangiaceae bacterium]